MPHERKRLRILCEDRRTERFARALCKHYGMNDHDLGVSVAPSGRGDASVWVMSEYPKEVRKRRSKNFQENLGLLVLIDGDNHGVAVRKQQLDVALSNGGTAVRAASESIAVFVPTWSVETWLACLNRMNAATESESLKDHPEYRDMWRDKGPKERDTIQQAAQAWKSVEAPVPSLVDAYNEAARVWLS